MPNAPTSAGSAWQEADALWLNATLATMDPTVDSPYGSITGHALGIKGDRILGYWPISSIDLSRFQGDVHDAEGCWITPGLIDPHTHLVFAGSRANEWEMRLTGKSYVEIAQQGGGILNTVRTTRQATVEELYELAASRLPSWFSEGVTCIEIKTGYGLTIADELKMLRVVHKLRETFPIDISPTLLAAHTVPPEYKTRPDAYVELIVKELLPQVKEGQLAEAVDVFCESIAFSLPQSQRIWHAAKEMGLGIKGHVEQLSNLQAAKTLATLGGWSADHLEYLEPADVPFLQQSDMVATLLPGAYYFLREQQKPPISALREAGVTLAVGTDFNPGTSPFASIQLAMNQACVLYGLTPEEALAGATRGAAQALNRSNMMGIIAAGRYADLAVWSISHPAEIVCGVGWPILKQRIYHGRAYGIST